MRKIVLFFTLVLVSLGAQAQNKKSIVDLNRSTENLRNENVRINSKISDLKISSDEADKALASAKKEFEDAYRPWKATAGGWFGFLEGSGDPVKRAKRDEAEEKMKLAEKNVRNLSEDMKNLKNSSEKLRFDSDKEERDLKAELATMKALMTADHLLSDFSIFENKVGDNKQALDILQMEWDNSMLAGYLRSKMGELLNSDLVCAATKNCPDKPIDPITDAKLKAKIFNKRSNNSSNSNSSAVKSNRNSESAQ